MTTAGGDETAALGLESVLASSMVITTPSARGERACRSRATPIAGRVSATGSGRVKALSTSRNLAQRDGYQPAIAAA